MSDPEIEAMCAAWARRQWDMRWPDEVPPHLRSDWREAMIRVREVLDGHRAAQSTRAKQPEQIPD